VANSQLLELDKYLRRGYPPGAEPVTFPPAHRAGPRRRASGDPSASAGYPAHQLRDAGAAAHRETHSVAVTARDAANGDISHHRAREAFSSEAFSCQARISAALGARHVGVVVRGPAQFAPELVNR
jgi:hypothetical protein